MKSKEVNSEEIEEINNKIKQKLNRAVQSDRDLGGMRRYQTELESTFPTIRFLLKQQLYN